MPALQTYPPLTLPPAMAVIYTCIRWQQSLCILNGSRSRFPGAQSLKRIPLCGEGGNPAPYNTLKRHSNHNVLKRTINYILNTAEPKL